MAVFDDGRGPALYIGASNTGGPFQGHGIAKWDGQSWSDLGGGLSQPATGFNPSVLALAVFDDGSGPALYVGGGFTHADSGQTELNYIARWKGQQWSALGSGMSGSTSASPAVRALTVFDDGTGPALYAGGFFLNAGGVAVNRIAKWNGQHWSALDGGIGGSNVSSVRALAAFDDGSGSQHYVGGGFTSAGSISASNIARWDGTQWSTVGSGLNALVLALEALHSSGGHALYVGGSFTFTTDFSANLQRIGKWDGRQWSGLAGGVRGPSAPTVRALAIAPNQGEPVLFAGGQFTKAGGIDANRIAIWSLLDDSLDTDGDGVPDCWEIYGIPYTDKDGKEQRYELPQADPMRKNLWIEVDAMTGSSLSDVAVGMLEFVFDFAPVSNPGGESGIILHIHQDESNLPHVPLWETDGCWPLDFDDVRANHFGTSEERDDPSAEALLEAKAKAFRYAIVADEASEDGKPNGLGGCGETPGDNFVLFLGANMFNHSDPIIAAERQAALFMHELGHNLGLGHGGGDCINGKPNYPSVMNYLTTYRYSWNEAFWKLDYSRAGNVDTGHGVLADLDESCLNEEMGIGTPGGYYDHNGNLMPIGVNVELFDGTIVREIEYVPLNGSPIDFGDRKCGGQPDGDSSGTCVCQDLNHLIDTAKQGGCGDDQHPFGPSPGEKLTSHNDWAKIVLATAAIRGDAAPAVSFPQGELTDAMVEEIEKTFPPPEPDPPMCPTDLTGDGVVGVADLLVVLASWGPCPPPPPACPADFTGDGNVGVPDLLELLSAWGPCPQ